MNMLNAKELVYNISLICSDERHGLDSTAA